MTERMGTASWPGIISIGECEYTATTGISPSIINLTAAPQDSAPDAIGTLTMSDGVNTVVLTDCKIKSMRTEVASSGSKLKLAIEDFRWRWRDTGDISGSYNQLDPLSKLIPWTIRSPTELAELCLQAMGVIDYDIDMPSGLEEADGVNHGQQNPIWLNVIPTTGTNPPVNWVNTNPASALSNLCNQYGRIIAPTVGGTLIIAKQGVGDDLPDGGSVASDGAGITVPALPKGVKATGSPTRYQARLLMEAVGRDWDTHFRPINNLSYTPISPAKPQITQLRLWGVSHDNETFVVYINSPDSDRPRNGVSFSYKSGPGDGPQDVLANLRNQINGSNDPRIVGVVMAFVTSGNSVEIRGLVNGFHFTVATKSTVASGERADLFLAVLSQVASKAAPTWRWIDIPTFNMITPTNRLLRYEATALAKSTVFKCYRVMDVGRDRGPITIPGYVDDNGAVAPLIRRQQIILSPTQVKQVVPQVIDLQLQQFGPNGNQPFNVNFYNGYSRDIPAAAYGQTFGFKQKAVWGGHRGVNSAPGRQILIDFSVDPYEQVITFSDYVYYAAEGGAQANNAINANDNLVPWVEAFGLRVRIPELNFSQPAGITPPPKLMLETGVTIRDSDTNAIDVHVEKEDFPNGTGYGYTTQKFPDIQKNIVTDYGENDQILGVRLLEADAIVRAKYYLTGMKEQFLNTKSRNRQYNGIELIDLSGRILQVSWKVGSGGAMTTASLESEHAIFVPRMAERRRAEFMAPADQANQIIANNRLGARLMNGEQ